MDTREHILRESLKLFLQKSFKDVTLSEILQKTELSKGGFYYYFKSKEELFMEIAEGFFSYLIVYNFDSYSTDSLQHFIRDHVNDLEKSINRFTSDKESLGSRNAMNINYFYPIFDALRMLPEFGKKFQTARTREIGCWTNAVDRAKESGEIHSVMTSEQIALMFVYTGNSIGLQWIMEDRPIESMTGMYLSFWNNFYESLKV